MTQRPESAEAFLTQMGWAGAVRSPIAGDMSYRHYTRLDLNGRSALLMDAPPDKGEDCRPFTAICTYYRSLGFSAPEIYELDLDQGFMIIEDLGTGVFARLIEQGTSEQDLYQLALDWLVTLQQEVPPADLPLPDGSRFVVPAYEGPELAQMALLFARWYLPAISGRPTSPELLEEFVQIWQDLCVHCIPDRAVLVHRDFHAENLFLMPQREGNARLGVIDFQDGVTSVAAYDLVSLLEDARRDVAPEFAQKMKADFIERGGHDRAAFEQTYAVIGAQRNLRIIGVFARYWLRQGGAKYLKLIPRVFSYIEQDLHHPVLAPLKKWLDEHVPPEVRFHEPDLGLRDDLRVLTGSLEHREP